MIVDGHKLHKMAKWIHYISFLFSIAVPGQFDVSLTLCIDTNILDTYPMTLSGQFDVCLTLYVDPNILDMHPFMVVSVSEVKQKSEPTFFPIPIVGRLQRTPR